MNEEIKLIECPRDAWQGLKGQIPTDIKVAYLRALIATGFRHLDAVSFVSPRAVPQMADSEQVLRDLKPPEEVEIIGIVVNDKGAQRAAATPGISTLGFPYSVSPTFLQRNQNQSLDDAYDEMEKVKQRADDGGLDVVVYISMAFGNPYGDIWTADEVVEAVGLVEQMGIKSVSLADTAGDATPERVHEVVDAVTAKYGYLEIGAHLHSRPGQSGEKIIAAYEAGARRFESAIGGLGGCPFAQDALVGNIATETLLETMHRLGLEPPELKPLDAVIRMSEEIATRHRAGFAAD